MAQDATNQNLVWCIDSPGFGGSERDLVRVLEWASVAGWRQLLVHANPLDPRLEGALSDRGVRTRRITGGSRLADLSRAWRAAGELIADLEGARWIVWCHHYDTCRWLQLRLALSRKRFAVVERAMARDRSDLRRSRLTVPLKWLVGRRGVATVVPGHAQVAIYRTYFRLPSSRVRCVPNSRDVAAIASRARESRTGSALAYRVLSAPKGTPVVCCVARFEEGKALKVLVSALGLLREQGSNVHLCLVGDGPERSRIGALCEKLLPGLHTLVGEQADPIPFLALADVFVFPSRHEGLSGAVIEAMAAGVPVVVSDIPGNRELVENEQTGLIFPVDDANGAAKAIRRFLEEPELAEHCAAGAYERVRLGYDASVEKAGWLALLKEME